MTCLFHWTYGWIQVRINMIPTSFRSLADVKFIALSKAFTLNEIYSIEILFTNGFEWNFLHKYTRLMLIVSAFFSMNSRTHLLKNRKRRKKEIAFCIESFWLKNFNLYSTFFSKCFFRYILYSNNFNTSQSAS